MLNLPDKIIVSEVSIVLEVLTVQALNFTAKNASFYFVSDIDCESSRIN
jgi:hypothetical protein